MKIINKIFFVTLIVILLCTTFSYGADEGIMPLGLITDSQTDENSNTTISYQINDTDGVYTGSFTMSSEFRSTLTNYAIFVCHGKVFVMDSDKYSNFLLGNSQYSNNWTTYIGMSSDFTECGEIKLYMYENNSFRILSQAVHAFILGDISPNQFLYSNGVSVFYHRFTGLKVNENLDSAKYHGYSYVYDCSFNIKDPYLLSYENNVFNFALKSFYPGYEFDYDVNSSDLSVKLGTINDFTFYIYNANDVTQSATLSLAQLSKYITDNEKYGKILSINLSDLPVTFSEGAQLNYEFSFTGVYNCKVHFSHGTNSDPLSEIECLNYDAYYGEYIEDSFTYGVDIPIPGEGGTTIDDKFNEMTNTLVDSNNRLDNSIKEQTQVQKGIFESIGEVLSYINPFSENFFVYKLIDLLVDAIKSLFIPSDEFLGSFFDNLKKWFSDRLGFLFYPFELILDVLDKMLNIDFSSPVFNIPDIKEPFTNTLLIGATSFNLNDMLQQSAFKTAHDIYLVLVDAFIIFGLVNLAKRKYEEVTAK